MKYTLFIFLLPYFLFSQAQDTIYIDQSGEELPDKTNARFYKILHYENLPAGIEVFEKKFYVSGKKNAETYYSNYDKKLFEGRSITWTEGGAKHIESTYRKGKLHGPLYTFWPSGEIRREDVYKNGKLKEGQVWDENGEEITYYPMTEPAEYPGGKHHLQQFLKNNLKSSKNSERFVVGFVVDTTGKLKDIEFKEGENLEKKMEIFRVLNSMPAWIPGKFEGELKGFYYRLPIVL